MQAHKKTHLMGELIYPEVKYGMTVKLRTSNLSYLRAYKDDQQIWKVNLTKDASEAAKFRLTDTKPGSTSGIGQLVRVGSAAEVSKSKKQVGFLLTGSNVPSAMYLTAEGQPKVTCGTRSKQSTRLGLGVGEGYTKFVCRDQDNKSGEVPITTATPFAITGTGGSHTKSVRDCDIVDEQSALAYAHADEAGQEIEWQFDISEDTANEKGGLSQGWIIFFIAFAIFGLILFLAVIGV